MRSFGAQENLKGARHGTLGRCLAPFVSPVLARTALAVSLTNRGFLQIEMLYQCRCSIFFVSKKRC